MKNLVSFFLVVLGLTITTYVSADTRMISVVQDWMAPLEGKYMLKGSPGCETIEIRKREIEPDYEIYEIASGYHFVGMYYVYAEDAVKVKRNSLRYSFEDRDLQQVAVLTKDKKGQLKSVYFKMTKPAYQDHPRELLFEYTCYAR